MRVGIYPGSFDPIHRGHVAFAEEAAKVCGLERVVFLPESLPRNKPEVTPLTERLDTLRRALTEYSNFDVAALHSSRFTVHESLPELLTRFPNHELTLLVGSDVAKTLEQWVDIDTLLSHMSLAIGRREPETTADVLRICQSLSATHPSFAYRIIEAPHAHLSSRQLRVAGVRQRST